jgi:hypothetical protein
MQRSHDSDPNPFEAALSSLLHDTDQLRAMGERARERAAAMQFSDSAARISELLRKFDVW